MTHVPIQDLLDGNTQDLDQVAGPDTGPLLILRAQGLSTRQIGRRLNMSQSSVQRKLAQLRQVLDQEEAPARRPAIAAETWRLALGAVLALSLLVIAASLATLAWG